MTLTEINYYQTRSGAGDNKGAIAYGNRIGKCSDEQKVLR